MCSSEKDSFTIMSLIILKVIDCIHKSSTCVCARLCANDKLCVNIYHRKEIEFLIVTLN